MFVCDETVPGVRVLVLNTGSNAKARKMIVDCIAFKYYGSIDLATQSFVDQSMCISLPISIMYCTIYGESINGVHWQK